MGDLNAYVDGLIATVTGPGAAPVYLPSSQHRSKACRGDHYSTYHCIDTETDLPVVVEYSSADGEVEILAIRVDMPGEPGPSFLDDLDEDEVREFEHEIMRGPRR